MRIKTSLYLILFTLFGSTTSFATPLRSEEAPLALRESTECTFNVDGSRDCIFFLQYTVLKPEGRNSISRMDFSYNEEDTLDVKLAQYYPPGSSQAISLSETLIDEKMMPNPEQGFSRNKMISMAFPDLQVGSIIQIKLKRHYKKIPFYNEFYFDSIFYPSNLRYDDINLTFHAEQKIIVAKEYADIFDIKKSKDEHHVSIKLKSPPYFNQFTNENTSNAEAFIRHNPRVIVTSSQNILDHYNEISRKYNDIIDAPLPKKLHAVVASIKKQPFEEQINSLMAYIYTNYRYLGDWRKSSRGLIPETLNEIVKNGYGDCKDLSTLLSSLLRHLNIKSEIGLIYRGDDAPHFLVPGVGAPNHAIVRAEKNGKVIWLDPTNPFFNISLIPLDIADRWVIILSNEKPKSIRQEKMPDSTTISNRVQKEIDLIGRTAAKVKIEQWSNIMSANLSMQDRQYGQETVNQMLCQNSTNYLVQGSCQVTRQTGTFLLPKNYRVQVRYEDTKFLEEIVPQTYFMRYTNLQNMLQDLKTYKEQNHVSDLYFGYKYHTSDETTLMGYRIGKPRQCQVTSPWFDIHVKIRPGENNQTQISYEYKIKKSWIDHATLNSKVFQGTISSIEQCVLNSNLLITH